MGTFYVSTEPRNDWVEFVSKGQIPPWWKQVAENNIVKGGAAFIEDRAIGNTSSTWKDSVISYMALGTGDGTNAGLPGPSDGDKPVAGDWQGSSKLDWKLTSEINEIGGGCRVTTTFTRYGDVMTISGLFTDAQINVGTTACRIREWGLFLGATIPLDNPFDDEDEQLNAMVARAVKMKTEGAFYVDAYELKNQDGRDLEFFYMFRVK